MTDSKCVSEAWCTLIGVSPKRGEVQTDLSKDLDENLPRGALVTLHSEGSGVGREERGEQGGV